MTDDTDIQSDRDALLRRALRGLRRDSAPQRDLWPAIAAQITSTRAIGTRRGSRAVPWALAASLLLAFGVAWQWPTAPVLGIHGNEPLLASEARAMTRSYASALQEILASAPLDPGSRATLRQLDQSAAQIRSALARDPDARFLLDRLRRTYSLRLALTQRAVLG